MSRGKKKPLVIARARRATPAALPGTKEVDRSLGLELAEYVLALTGKEYNLFKGEERRSALLYVIRELERFEHYLGRDRDALRYHRGKLRSNTRLVDDLECKLQEAQRQLASVDSSHKYPWMKLDINSRHILKTAQVEISHHQQVIKDIVGHIERLEAQAGKIKLRKDAAVYVKEQFETIFNLTS
jgi:hypothetical protein